jgi:hypothetical protein
MSRILALNPPYEGLSTIVNVLKRVGPGEANDTADVRVVQRLIQMGARSASAETRSVGFPSVTGRYDAMTGFWIYHLQAFSKRSNPLRIVDGIVSPAHGASYASNTHWTIVLLNKYAKDHSPSEFSAFLASGGVS